MSHDINEAPPLYSMNFYNQVIDKKGLKRIVSWFVENYGPTRTAQLIEDFQFLGFHYATQAGLSLGFEDLRIPPTKATLLEAAQKQVLSCQNNYLRGHITALERYQKLIDIWTTTSENLKEEVIQNFQKTPLNPLYMMAFSGARGNISQVRQLVGMRGLMSDSGGGIIDFPIRSNFREGLSVTEYVISCYGARKGLIDTALRTADSGYLTRRLVDVAHAILITEIDCGTSESILVAPLEKNLLGRVLAENIHGSQAPVAGSSHLGTQIIARKNQDISAVLAREILQAHRENGSKTQSKSKNADVSHMIRVRSPLSCEAASANLCQMCYGWNLAQGRFVSIGDAVGILAAQSIGEPGTQLTMRTFHTGGIFSTDVEDKIFAPHDGYISYQKLPKGCKLRSVHGETGFFSQEPVQIRISSSNKASSGSILQLPAQSLIFVYPGKFVSKNELCAEISRLTPNLALEGSPQTETSSQSLNSGGAASAPGTLNKKVSPAGFGSKATDKALSGTKVEQQKTNDESSSEIQGAAYKLVFSEIQGQVSLGYGQNFTNTWSSSKQNESNPSVLPNEVWVLAAERLETGFQPEKHTAEDYAGQKLNSRTQRDLSLNFLAQNRASRVESKFAQSGTREEQKSSRKSLSRFLGFVGDLLYFSGNRASRNRSFVPHSSGQRGQSLQKLGKQAATEVSSSAFEVRDSYGSKAVLRLKEQKRPVFPKEIRERVQGTIRNSYILGSLIRSHDDFLKTEYSAQIIRKMSSRVLTQDKFLRAQASSLKDATQPTIAKPFHSIVIRRVQPHLVSGLQSPLQGANLRPLGSMVQEKDVLFQLLLPLQQSKTGDIVQGLPKIEQLFEGRGQLRDIASMMKTGMGGVPQPDKEKAGLNEATLQKRKYHNVALRVLQQRLVEEIQSVYQSQGVEIADKHVEIIVRLMTSKVKILEKGRTSFFPDDIVDLHHVRAANLPEAFYEPIVLGITKVAFLTESFVSAASFQETKRVLMNSAIQNRVDFLHGLKENVIVGRLIPAGTGFHGGSRAQLS